jgi:hypothetical protein
MTRGHFYALITRGHFYAHYFCFEMLYLIQLFLILYSGKEGKAYDTFIMSISLPANSVTFRLSEYEGYAFGGHWRRNYCEQKLSASVFSHSLEDYVMYICVVEIFKNS